MTIYENYFEVTEQLYCEALNKMVPVARFVLYGVAVAFLGISAAMMIIGKNYSTGALWVILALALAFYGFFGIPLKAKRFYRRQYPSICDKNGRFWKRTEFFEDKLTVTEPKSSATFKYSDIRAVNESKNLYVIVLEGRQLLFVKKGCFGDKTNEEFIDFLKGKCHAK